MQIEDCPDSSSDHDRAQRLQALLARVDQRPTEAEASAADAIDRLHAVRAKIKKWREKATPTATDLKNQEERLAQLEAEEQMLDAAVKNLRGDFAVVNDVSLLRRVVDAAESRPQGGGAKGAPSSAPGEHPPLSLDALQAVIEGPRPMGRDGVTRRQAVPSWQVYKRGHFQGYGPALYDLLKNASDAGLPKPNARDVLAAFAKAKPDLVYDVRSDGFVYSSPNGTRDANLRAINAAIQRMTSPKAKAKA